MLLLHRGGPFSWIDPPLLHREPRSCSNCQRLFQPTMRRRMLCAYCFRRPLRGLIEPGRATRPIANFNPNLIGRPVALRPLARTLLVPVRPREAVLHPAVAMANPDVEVWAVGLHGVVFQQ